MIIKTEGRAMIKENTKYACNEVVFVRIPAKYAKVPDGAVKQVIIHSISVWKDEIYYTVTSAKYGMLKFREEDVYKHRKDVK